MQYTLRTCLIISLLLAPLSMVVAQEQGLGVTQTPELSERVFKINYADTRSVRDAIRILLTPYGRISADRSTQSILVKDTEEALEKVARRIAEIDTPPDQIRLTFFAFKAYKDNRAPRPGNVPQGVKDALDEVSKLMMYSNYELIDSGMLTLISTARKGNLTLSQNLGIEFGFDYSQQSKLLRMNNFQVYTMEDGEFSRLFQTDVGVGNGEVIVAGASKLNGGNEALLVIVTMAAKSMS